MPVTRRPFVESDTVLDSAPERWFHALQRALGGDEVPDVAGLIGVPMMAGEGKVSRRLLAKGTERIAKGSQSSMGVENKIPRFRSPLGTFVKHEGQWWRIGKQPADALDIELELLPSGDELQQLMEQGIDTPPVLARKTIRADALMPKPKK